jgi:hypothetical protein
MPPAKRRGAKLALPTLGKITVWAEKQGSAAAWCLAARMCLRQHYTIHSTRSTSQAMSAAVALAEARLTPLLLSSGAPEMRRMPGPGRPVRRCVPALKPENCTVAPSSESTSEPNAPPSRPGARRSA